MSKILGVLVCDDSIETGGEDGLGKFFIDLFKKNEFENWEYFKVVSGHLPDKLNFDNYAGFILTGSCWSANDPAKWICDLTEFIQQVFEYQQVSHNAPKLFGSCFGHQIISKALGARVIKNKLGRFIISLADIEVLNDLQNKEFYRSVFGDEKYIRLVKCHEEEVTDLPSNAVLLGTSEYCKNEIVSFGDKVLTMQGHMDISEEELVGPYLSTLKKIGMVYEEGETFLLSSLNGKQNDCSKAVEMVRQFFNL